MKHKTKNWKKNNEQTKNVAKTKPYGSIKSTLYNGEDCLCPVVNKKSERRKNNLLKNYQENLQD